MGVLRRLIFGRMIDLATLHPQWAIAIVELIDEIVGSIGDTDRAYDLVPLNNHTARPIAFTPRRRHVEDSLRDNQLVTAWIEKISDNVLSLS